MTTVENNFLESGYSVNQMPQITNDNKSPAETLRKRGRFANLISLEANSDANKKTRKIFRQVSMVLGL